MNNGKYCPEIIETICNFIKEGKGQIVSAELAGINASTYFAWIHEHAEFSDAIKKAKEIGVANMRDKMLAVIEKAAIGSGEERGQWQAAAWRLERTLPDEFGKRERIDNRMDGEIRIKIAGDELEDDADRND